MTKVEELEKAVLMLEEQVATNKSMSETYQKDLELAQKQLADINKPVLTPKQLDNIQEAIEEGVGNFSFDDQDKYDKEFGIDYDGRVQLESLDFTEAQDLIEDIVEQVHKLFVEAECPTEEQE